MARLAEARIPDHLTQVAGKPLCSLVTGCVEEEYVGNVPNVFGPIGDEATAVRTLQKGVPVLFLKPGCSTFSRRVVKVDDGLSFLFIVDGLSRRDSRDAPVAVALQHISRVVDKAEALQYCRSFGLSAGSITRDSVNVVYVKCGHKSSDKEKALIILAAPSKELRWHIETACAVAANTKRPLDASFGVHSRRHVDTIQLADVWSIFLDDARDVCVTVSFRGGGDARTVRMPVDSKVSWCMAEATRVQQEECLAPVDVERLALALQEALLLRRWAEHVAGIVGDGWYKSFMSEESAVDSLDPIRLLAEACGEAAPRIILMESGHVCKNEADPKVHLGQAASRASELACSLLVELETERVGVSSVAQ
mmetsp:Transcript_65416/g.182002  ORF Transcript_65416/g.182002 Transcript_65416/m.182002 type:complete len:365 (-) Transcript_65416:119-1213(-)